MSEDGVLPGSWGGVKARTRKNEKMNKKNKRVSRLTADLTLILSLLLLAGVCFGIYTWTRNEGAVAVVRVNGVEQARYSLSEDRSVPITGYGASAGFNLLVIEDGRARVTNADCRDQICVGHAPIHRVGESIVCLPHRVTVTVERGR